jgi:hypothetical protein
VGSKGGSSKTTETALSKKQAEILAQAQAEKLSKYLPELWKEFEDTDMWGWGEKQALDQAQQVSEAGFERQQAQRGIAGGGFGQLSMGRFQNEAAKQRFAFANTLGQQHKQRRMQTLQQLGQFYPKPTTAAPMGVEKTGPSTSGIAAVGRMALSAALMASGVGAPAAFALNTAASVATRPRQ